MKWNVINDHHTLIIHSFPTKPPWVANGCITCLICYTTVILHHVVLHMKFSPIFSVRFKKCFGLKSQFLIHVGLLNHWMERFNNHSKPSDWSRKWSLDQDHDTNNRIWLCEFSAPEIVSLKFIFYPPDF